MSVPDDTRDRLRTLLWKTADEVGWATLSPTDKTKRYESWTRDAQVGGVLARYMDSGQVRVYLKDTLLKGYGRAHLADESIPFRVAGVDGVSDCVESYVKPHGRRLQDGRILCWGRADDWKSVLMAIHERAYRQPGARPFAAILLHPSGRYHEDHARAPIDDAALKLGIERLIWLDD